MIKVNLFSQCVKSKLEMRPKTQQIPHMST